MKDHLRRSMEPMMKEHRLEVLPTKDGIKFVNDSAATNVNSLWFTLEETTGPIVLIMGGVDKGNDYSIVTDLVSEKVTQIVMLGVSEYKKIVNAFGVHKVTIATSMSQAVTKALLSSRPGYTILLSPACASFDMFEDYEDRGQQFKNAIYRI